MENNKLKLCSFHVNDWHLSTMILPYINKEIKEKANIITILEKNIENNINTLIEKLNLKNKDEIIKIGWQDCQGMKYSETSKKLEKLSKDKLNIILVNGQKNFIDAVNENIERVLNKKSNNIKIKIVNCYEVIEFNKNILEILDNHDKILNTSGEKEIQEVFEDYVSDWEEKKNNLA